jgi:hypothetical protein
LGGPNASVDVEHALRFLECGRVQQEEVTIEKEHAVVVLVASRDHECEATRAVRLTHRTLSLMAAAAASLRLLLNLNVGRNAHVNKLKGRRGLILRRRVGRVGHHGVGHHGVGHHGVGHAHHHHHRLILLSQNRTRHLATLLAELSDREVQTYAVLSGRDQADVPRVVHGHGRDVNNGHEEMRVV